MQEEIEDKLALEPPEPQYISSLYVLKIPITDPHFNDPWKLRIYAAKLLTKKIGDEVQVTDLKVKKPRATSRLVSKFRKRVPEAKLYVTVKF